MRKFNRATQAIRVLGIGATLALLSGCGMTAYTEPKDTDGTGGSSTGGSQVIGDDGNFMPSRSFTYTLTGTGSRTTPGLNTDSILKVKVNAGSAGTVSVPGYGFSATYTCVTYQVTALGKTYTTQTLAVDGGTCQPGLNNQPPGYTSGSEITADSQVFDFSSRLVPGHGPVAVTVGSARYDFYCQLYWNYYFMFGPYNSSYNPFAGQSPSLYCPLKTVYSTHTVGVSLDIQLNGTTL